MSLFFRAMGSGCVRMVWQIPAVADPICYADGVIPMPSPMFPLAIPVLDAYSSGADDLHPSKFGVVPNPINMIIAMLKVTFPIQN